MFNTTVEQNHLQNTAPANFDFYDDDDNCADIDQPIPYSLVEPATESAQ